MSLRTAQAVCVPVPEQTAPRQAMFGDDQRNKKERFYKNKIKLDQNGGIKYNVHPHTFLQVLGCKHKRSAVGRSPG